MLDDIGFGGKSPNVFGSQPCVRYRVSRLLGFVGGYEELIPRFPLFEEGISRLPGIVILTKKYGNRG